MFISAWPKERLTIRPWEPVTGRIHWQFEWNLSHVYTYIHLIIIPNLVQPVLYTTDMIANATLWYLYTISYLLYEGGSRIEENNCHLWKHSYHLWELVKSVYMLRWSPMLRFGVFVRRWPWYLNNMCSLRANLAKVSAKILSTMGASLSHKHIHTHFCCLPIQHT